jgi:hypothetical protein
LNTNHPLPAHRRRFHDRKHADTRKEESRLHGTPPVA